MCPERHLHKALALHEAGSQFRALCLTVTSIVCTDPVPTLETQWTEEPKEIVAEKNVPCINTYMERTVASEVLSKAFKPSNRESWDPYRLEDLRN
jgi:hypothetical protein